MDDPRHEEVIAMAEREKRIVVPMTNIMHDDGDSGFRIEVDLVGASKDSVDLEMGAGGFCVKAEGEEIRYESCFMLAHEVRAEEAKAKFESGLLTVHVPFRGGMRGHKVAVH
jgi:HSP20 family molecular chaperone IbpA